MVDNTEVNRVDSECINRFCASNIPTEMYIPKDLFYGEVPLCHYTSADGLLGILENQCLWATSAAHLKDTTDVKIGLDQFDTVLTAYINVSVQ